MTRIDSAAQLAALIRQQIANSRGAASLRARQPQAGTAGRRTAGESAKPSAGLAATIAQRVAAIDPDDPDRPRKAFRVFLEAVLLSELGQHLANDPAFYQVVSDVQQQMQADPGLSVAIDRASTALLGKTSGG
ncbi:hypothetical protein [Paraburkholderia acidicola]|nr:hypothetical protein [Paraburkholderia acidicola]